MKTNVVDKANAIVVIEGKTFQKVSISLDIKSNYQNLVGFLSQLNNELPLYVTVERCTIDKLKKEVDLLDVKLILNIYLLA